jgi:hypothetical protein
VSALEPDFSGAVRTRTIATGCGEFVAVDAYWHLGSDGLARSVFVGELLQLTPAGARRLAGELLRAAAVADGS